MEDCLCKRCLNQLICTECEFCKASVSDGCAPVIQCPDYKCIDGADDAD